MQTNTDIEACIDCESEDNSPPKFEKIQAVGINFHWKKKQANNEFPIRSENERVVSISEILQHRTDAQNKSNAGRNWKSRSPGYWEN